MKEFDGNAYRKEVLAPIEARGGIPASDPFEWYDLPLDESLKDAAVRSQVDAVWAFWQKQREAPKYRGLILALLARHEEIAPLLWSKSSRRELVEQVRSERAGRAVDRFAELDAAIARLVERFGGIPASKVEGIVTFAVERDISEADARARVAQHPTVADQAKPGAVDPYRRTSADLEELGRLLEGPPFASLFALLDLPPTASRREIMQARDRVATRNRELLPDRRRALVDDLLAAVTTLLVEGDPETYLSALAVDVAEAIRPKFQAAVLVEDLLTADDAAYLISEAEALGLDAARARDVVVQLAREAGVPMPATARRPEPTRTQPSGGPAPSTVPEGYRRERSRPSAPAPPPTPPPAPASAWHDELSAARAALRAGRALEAQRRVAQARSLAGGITPPVRALSDEVEAVLAEAIALWKAVEQALAARRLPQVLESLERLQAIAADVPSPTGRLAADLLAEARPAVAAVAEEVARAQALPGAEQEDALLRLSDENPGSEVVRTALEAVGVAPPANLRQTVGNGSVHLTWAPSPSRGRIDYRVVAIDTDGRRRALGTTAACDLEIALPPGALPSYAVVARRAGVSSSEVVTGATVPEPAGASRPALEIPPVTDLAVAGDRLTWTWPHGITEVQVVWRLGTPPAGPDDPEAQRRKVTNTRYALDSGAPAPVGPDVHVAVFACTRMNSTLITSPDAGPTARVHY